MNEEEKMNEEEMEIYWSTLGDGRTAMKEEEKMKDEEKMKAELIPAKKWLVPLAFVIAVFFDRLVIASVSRPGAPLFFFSAIFWLVYLAVFYGYNLEKLRHNRLLFIIAGCVSALCVWNFIFDYRSSYGFLTWLVIPGVLMVHAQYITGDFTLKQVGVIAREWLLGWVFKPFSAVPMFFEAIQSSTSGKNPIFRKVIIGVLITLPLLFIILPLLSGADMVFGYYLKNLLVKFNLRSFFTHTIIVCVVTLLFFSFFWNVRFRLAKQSAMKKNLNLDVIITGIVLGIVIFIYILFCVVQFTYLFAGAGLPNELTYSEYARQGFWQLIVIAGINLFIFGMTLQYTQKNKVITMMSGGLLVLTACMLVSAFRRLTLYIDTYGMTWLRLLSAWFIIYLAAVLVLCAVRMFKEKLPLMVICGTALLVWYTVLGYANPDGFIVRYNLKNNSREWTVHDENYIRSLSDDATIAFLKNAPTAYLKMSDDYGMDNNVIERVAEREEKSAELGYSISSSRARKLIKEFIE